ncbi:MAG TPA: acyltransferase family protein [Lacunisphaera sp.]|jgi:peptidoglycan/LPS O-acetylase OafA/YrhL|nr:acyltransferase family protein [Lacunisphaera sp.]
MSAARPGRPGYLAHVDGLRAVAVAAVLIYHAFPDAGHSGFVGVDIFFVISGFLITGILLGELDTGGLAGLRAVARFYGRRIKRIFPALICVLLACYLLGYWFLLPGEFARLSQQILSSAGFFINFALARHNDYFDNGATSNPLLHLWSLAIEEQFYLVWPCLLWLLFRGRIRALPIMLFVCAASFTWNFRTFDSELAASFFLPHMRIWELGLGGVAAAFLAPGRTTWFSSAAGAAPAPAPAWRWLAAPLGANFVAGLGLALLVAGFVYVDSGLPHLNAWMLLPGLGTAFLICAGDRAWINRRMLSQPALVGLGLISYPLYLWHWPLLFFARVTSDHVLSVPVLLSLLGCAVALAYVTYRWVEQPLRRAARPGWVVTGAVATLAAVALVAYGTERAAGFPGRLPPLLNQIAAFSYNPAAAVRQGTYFIMGDVDETAFKIDPHELDPAKPTIYLWGDSHAATLYAGLERVLGQKFNIAERAAATTAPFPPEDFNPGNARRINAFILASIARDRPEVVILHADWQRYDWRQVAGTVAALRRIGTPHIVLVGPVPHWLDGLPQQLFNFARRHHDAAVPQRMDSGLDPATARTDALMAELAAQLQVTYLSPLHLLRNGDGMLVRVGDTPDALLTFDTSHLTAKAAEYLVRQFPPLTASAPQPAR